MLPALGNELVVYGRDLFGAPGVTADFIQQLVNIMYRVSLAAVFEVANHLQPESDANKCYSCISYCAEDNGKPENKGLKIF